MSGTHVADGADLATAREVADAVLYEGYVLFPYRASAAKNRYRWQWGVVAPAAHLAAGGGAGEGDPVVSRTVVRGNRDARMTVTARFLQARRRQVRDADGNDHEELEVGDRLLTTWDEGVEHEVTAGPVDLATLQRAPAVATIDLPATHEVEEVVTAAGEAAASMVRTTEAVTGRLEVTAAAMPGGVFRVTARIDNTTGWARPEAPRDVMLRHSLLGAHLLLVADDAVFASVADPPDWAAAAVAGPQSEGTHPVPVGDDDRVVLSSPIILPDHPEIAPESPGPSFDATEIDELLTLAVHGLTDEEKRRARATDPRAAEIVDRADVLPPRVMAHLHGTLRDFASAGVTESGDATESADVTTGNDPVATRDLRPPDRADGEPPSVRTARRDDGVTVRDRRGTVADPRGDPRFAPMAPEDGGPDLDDDTVEVLGVGDEPVEAVRIAGRRVQVGDRVRVAPARRADAQDMFVAGRSATVARIVRDVDGNTSVAVTLDDDPAAEFHDWYGRHLFFRTDELQPLEEEMP